MGKPERRTDKLGARLWSVVEQAFVQRRSLKDFFPGFMHLLVFWGTVVLLIGTALATVDWDVTHLFFDFQFLTGTVYVVFEIFLDIFGILLLVGLGIAIYRRYIARPDRLQNMPNKAIAGDDAYVIIMLTLITISGYLVEGLRIAVTQPAWASWSPVGTAISKIFLATGDPTNATLHLALWIVHIGISFALIASIPFTKLFHILASPFNIFFRSLEPVGALAPARYNSGPGVSQWTEFTWKQILDFESCTRCGRCQDECPAHASGTPLSPRDIMLKLDAHIYERKNGRSLHGDVISGEEIWACTTCLACVSVCPVFIDHVGSITDMRRHLVDEGQVDAQLQDALANLGRYGNSFGKSERMRAKWTQPLDPKIKDARREPVEYLWFVGDYASYHANLTDTTLRTAEVFRRAGIDFGILYDGERNSGNDARRIGEEGLFEMLVEENMAAMEQSNFRAVVTTDPHSYNTLKNEYPDNDHDVVHYAELLDELISSGKLKFSKQLNYTVTYQDPCYLGRYNEIYDAPRRVIEATGCKLVEMPRTREKAFCCAAGGGRLWMEETEIEERPSEGRIHEAAGLPGIQALVVACPKDNTMYQDAVKTTGQEDQLVVKDLIDLVHEAL
jgi:Fe-S oxidoreductase/nitrate reductase gamma subunit